MEKLAQVAGELVSLLTEKHKTVSTAESCTGGLIAKCITDVPGASSVFAGGCVTYTEDAKHRLVGVPPQRIAACGVVSEEVARAMAEGVRERLGTDFAVSVTGLAGPGGGTPEMPVGTVWLATADQNGTVANLCRFPENATREEIRTLAATEAVRMLLKLAKTQ